MKTGKKIWRKVWKLVTVCLVLLLALFCVLEGIVVRAVAPARIKRRTW